MSAYREVRVLSIAEAAYLSGLSDGKGTVTLSRKHAGEMRQLVVSISTTELDILEFARLSIGAGKVTRKRTAKAHHTPNYAYTLWNRQALALLAQIEPSDTMRAARGAFEGALLGLASGRRKKEPLQPCG